MITPIEDGPPSHDPVGWSALLPYADETSMDGVDHELAMAARRVADARHIVSRQRARILRLKALGSVSLDQELTLHAFNSSLALVESHAQGLADAAKRLERSQRKLS
jgi:hypothetical protein